ncbi:MAG TPA: hypothetical protein VHK28_07880 [Candidatus Limnocylindria bacterium]|nr:hypothetical protein [Candidatus Limnocylindria bacterium]
MRPPVARAIAVALFVLGMGMIAYGFASLVLPGTELIPDRPSVFDFVLVALIFIAFPVVGLLVVWQRTTHPIGWLFLVTGITITASVFASEYADRHIHTDVTYPGVEVVAWLGGWTWFLGAGLATTFAVLLFPTGRLPGPRWRPVAWAAGIALATAVVGDAIRPGPVPGYEEVPILKPFAVDGALGEAVAAAAGVAFAAVLALGVVSVSSLAFRFRRSVGQERQQLKWFLYPTALLVVGLAVASVIQTDAAWSAALLGMASIPVCAGIAILRHRLFDIDLVINRTLVYGSLTVLLGGIYIGSVLGLQALITPLLGTDTVAVAASTLAVAALFGPARHRVQAAVNRRFYRSRYDAQRTLAAFSGRLRDEVDPEHLTDELRAATEATLRPSSAWVWLRDG